MTTFSLENENGVIAVKITANEPVNAWQGKINFQGLVPISVDSADSVASLWQTPPRIEDGAIIFAGGKMGGFEGSGVLFRFSARGSGSIAFDPQTAAYLNDGKGTPAQASLTSLTFEGSGQAQGVDTIPPDPFTPALYVSKDLFQGQPVVIFSATDGQSGIAGYEIREITTHGEGAWHIAQSPYLVNPDVRRIDIRAIDNADNMRVESIRTAPLIPHFALGILFLVALLISGAILFLKKRKI